MRIAQRIFLSATWLCAAALPVLAQPQAETPPLDAAAVAAQVQAFYDQNRTVQADFSQSYLYKIYQRQERSQGRVVFKKPGKMRWDYAQPNGKVIVSDGRLLQVYEPGDQAESGQLLEQKIDQHQLPAAFSFLLGKGKLVEDFHVRLLAAEGQAFRQGYVLELRPKKPQPQYERLVFYVGAGNSRGVVHRMLILDAAGNRNRFDFSHLRFDHEVSEERFHFRAPAKTRRVTL